MSYKNSLLAYWMFFLVAVFLLFQMALQVSPSVMAINLMQDLNIGPEQLGLLSGFFFYSYTLMQIPSGLLYDRFSAKIIIALSCLICAVGALIFAFTDQMQIACIGRLLLGFGSSFSFVGALVVAARWFSPSLFALLAGITQLIAGFGALGGAYPLAKAVDAFGWRESVSFLGFFGLGLSILCFVCIKNYPKGEEIHHESNKLGVLESVKLLIRESQNLYGAIYSFCTWGPVLIFAGLWGIPFFMTKYQITNAEAALFISWIWIGVAISSPLLGYLSDLIKRRKIVLVVSSLVGIVSSLIIIYGPNLPGFVLSLLLFFFGLACAAQILAFALIKENNRRSVIATGMGLNNMAVVMGGAVFQPLVGYLMSQTGSFGKGSYPLYAYTFSLGLVPICFFVAFLVACFLIKETYTKAKY